MGFIRVPIGSDLLEELLQITDVPLRVMGARSTHEETEPVELILLAPDGVGVERAEADENVRSPAFRYTAPRYWVGSPAEYKRLLDGVAPRGELNMRREIS